MRKLARLTAQEGDLFNIYMTDATGAPKTVLRPAMREAGWAGAVLLVTILFSSCLAPLGVYKYGKSAPEKGHLIQDVPFEKWLARNYCGPACLTMVLNYWGGHFTQQQVAADIYDSERQGTYSSELVFYPRTLGFMTYSFRGDLQILRDLVGQNIPVIALTKPILQLDKGHYRVVIGFDEAKREVIFHDPYFGDRYAMAAESFLKLWELGKGLNEYRWAMAVVPAGRDFPFPRLANHPLTAVNLATAYYRRSDYVNSREQWLLAAEQLPGDPYPLYSLGMVSLKMDNAGDAESYALAALKMDPKSAYALDVLGLAYAEQDRIPEALGSLGQAVRLAPDEKFIRDHYQQVRAIHDQIAGRENKLKKERSSEHQR